MSCKDKIISLKKIFFFDLLVDNKVAFLRILKEFNKAAFERTKKWVKFCFLNKLWKVLNSQFGVRF